MNKKLLIFTLLFAMLITAPWTALTANATETTFEPSVSVTSANRSLFDFDFQNSNKYEIIDDFEYYVNENNTITITGYSGNETDVRIPDNINNLTVTSIEARFPYSWQAYSVKSLFIPESITFISEETFGYCGNLTEFYVNSRNENYCSDDGILFSKDKTRLVFYPGGREGSYTVPNGVASIEDFSFYWAANLTSIDIPDSVKYIGNYAFCGCNALKSVDIPNSVTKLGNAVFFNCYNLTDVSIPNSVTEIGYEIFYGCVKLIEITIPDSVTSLGDEAFLGCLSLKSVTLSDNLTKIGYGVFIDCHELTSISVPENVTSIGNLAFAFCNNLTEVYIPSSVELIGETAFAEELIDYNTSINSKIVTISCIKDSYAETYAKENNINFKTIEITEPTGKSKKYGDIDGDDKISSADALLVLRYSVKLENFDDSQVKFADVDGDGFINSADSLAILRCSVGYRDNGILIK